MLGTDTYRNFASFRGGPASPKLIAALAIMAWTAAAWAQPAVAPAPAAAPTVTQAPAPPAPAQPAASATAAVPADVAAADQNPVLLPEVDDPMLAPLPPPGSVLTSWQQALLLVRARSTSRASALAQVDRASAQARLALTTFYPTLTATGSVTQHLLFGRGFNVTSNGIQTNVDIPDPSAIWSARLSLRQPVLNLKSWHEHATSEVAQRAAQLKVEDVERLVLAAVADTIVAVVTAERLAEISRVSLRSSLSTLDLTRRRARLGASSAVDVLRAEQEVALNRAQLVGANESLRRAREALGMALGYPEAWGVTPDIRLDELGEDAKKVCTPLTGIDKRADVRAARTEVEVARRNVDSPDYRLAPTLDMVSDLNYSTSANTANGRPLQWTVGALLTIPLFDGGVRSAEKQLNSSQLTVAEQNLTQVKRQAQLEVVQATRSVSVAEENYQVSRHSRDISKETSRLARLSFLNGKGTSFELVDATRRYQQAELDLAVKEFEVVRARILALLARANCDI